MTTASLATPTSKSSRKLTKSFCLQSRSRSLQSSKRPQTWTKPYPHLTNKTNLRCQRYQEVEDAGPELAEARVEVKTEVVEDKTGEEEEINKGPGEDQDTPPCLLKSVVIGIMSMGISLGTVWRHTPAHGLTSASRDHEGPASLTRKTTTTTTTTKYNMTSFSRA